MGGSFRPSVRRNWRTRLAAEGASTSEWLAERRDGDSGDDDEQAAIRKRAVAAIGSICGGDPTRSAGSSELVSEIISRKHAKGVASKP